MLFHTDISYKYNDFIFIVIIINLVWLNYTNTYQTKSLQLIYRGCYRGRDSILHSNTRTYKKCALDVGMHDVN